MSTHVFRAAVELPAPAEEVFAWHERPGAFERLAPPWQRVDVLERQGGIRDGDRVTLRLLLGPVPWRWKLEHRGYVAGREWTDVQLEGPFARWEHHHRFVPLDGRRCRLEDTVTWAPPLGRLGEELATGFTERSLERLFQHRHRLLRADLALHARFAAAPRRTVAVTGASGFVGAALCQLLSTGGHRVLRLVRRTPVHDDELAWSPEAGVADPARLAGVDDVVHLAGEPISGRWTAERRERILASRVHGTRTLARALAALPAFRGAFVVASGVGYYGDRGEEVLCEDSHPGRTFLAEVCQEWERAAEPARERGIRVVHARLGIVLDPAGGALGALLRPARLGLNAVLGTGAQRVPWVTRDDAISALYFALLDVQMTGPVNVTAPHPVPQAELARTLARVLGRPGPLRLPAWALRRLAGEPLAAELLASERVHPVRLQAAGYHFRDPALEPALRRLLGRPEEAPGAAPRAAPSPAG